MPDAGELEFRIFDPARPPASDLLAAMEAELTRIYGTTGPKGVPLRHDELAPPSGAYVVAFVGEEPVGGGGIREIGPGLGEVKRMYVVPSWRGRGVARRLLAALEREASALGFVRVRLDTGTAQADARHIYETSGYRPIADYNGNRRAAFWGEKLLELPDSDRVFS